MSRLLDDWWDAAQTYIDGDKDDSLGAAEYAVFHRQLHKIVEANAAASGDSNVLSSAEADAVLDADFRADAGVRNNGGRKGSCVLCPRSSASCVCNSR